MKNTLLRDVSLELVWSQLLNLSFSTIRILLSKTAMIVSWADFLRLSVDTRRDLTVNQDLNLPDEHAVSASLHSQGRGCPNETLHPADGQCQGNEHEADVWFLKDAWRQGLQNGKAVFV